VASWKHVDHVVDKGQEFVGALIDVKTLKTEHAERIGHTEVMFPGVLPVNGCVHLHVAVAVKVHDHDHDHDHGRGRSTQPQADARDLKQREEARLGLVVASADGAESLQLVETALDEITGWA
jgi:hypothetical protein